MQENHGRAVGTDDRQQSVRSHQETDESFNSEVNYSVAPITQPPASALHVRISTVQL
jgi:hypothetical protein